MNMKIRTIALLCAMTLIGCATAPNDGLRYFRYNKVTHTVDQIAPPEAYVYDPAKVGTPEMERFHAEAEQETAKREAYLESIGMRHVEFQDIPIHAPETGTRVYPDGRVEHVYIPSDKP
jgi:hypothetical protein